MKILHLKPTYLLLAMMALLVQCGNLFIPRAIAAPPPDQYPIITPENAPELNQISFLGRGYVTGIAWSPNGKILAVASSCGVWLYNTNDFTSPPRQIKVDSTGIWFSPDGTRLASNDRQRIHIYETDTLQLVKTLPGAQSAAAFSSDWSHLFTSDGDGAHLWRPDDGTLLRDLNIRSINENSEVTFNVNGSLLAYTQEDSAPDMLSVGSNTPFIALEENLNAGAVRSIAFSPDGATLASGGGIPEGSDAGDPDTGNSVQAWSLTTGELIFSIEDDGLRVSGIAYSPDGKTLASGSDDGTVRLRDPRTGYARLTRRGGKYLAFSPDSTRIATSNDADGNIRVYNVSTGASLATLSAFGPHPAPIFIAPSPVQVGFNANSQQVFSIFSGQNIRLWDIASGTFHDLDHSSNLESVVFSPDSREIETTSDALDDRTVSLWDTQSGELLNETTAANVLQTVFTPQGYAQSVILHDYGSQAIVQDLQTGFISSYLNIDEAKAEHSSVSSDGKLFAAHYPGGIIKVWDIGTGQLVHSLSSQIGGDAASLQFSPNEDLLIVSNGAMRTEFWDLANNQLLFSWNWVASSILFSNDEQLLYVDGNIWSGKTGNLLANGFIPGTATALSPDGKLLALGDILDDPQIFGKSIGEIRILDTHTGDVITTLEPDGEGVIGLAFSPDGRMLATVSLGNTMQLWAIKSELF